MGADGCFSHDGLLGCERDLGLSRELADGSRSYRWACLYFLFDGSDSKAGDTYALHQHGNKQSARVISHQRITKALSECASETSGTDRLVATGATWMGCLPHVLYAALNAQAARKLRG